MPPMNAAKSSVSSKNYGKDEQVYDLALPENPRNIPVMMNLDPVKIILPRPRNELRISMSMRRTGLMMKKMQGRLT